MADYQKLRAVPFTDVCPTAYDGQEFIYTFYFIGNVEIISSCEYQIEQNEPLFAAIFDVLSELETTN